MRVSILVGVKTVAVVLFSLLMGFLTFLLLVWALGAMFALAGWGVVGVRKIFTSGCGGRKVACGRVFWAVFA